MNHFLNALIVTLSLSILMLVGCGEKQDASQSQKDVTAEDVKEEAVQAMEKVQAYTQQEKEEYQRELDEELIAMDQKIGELETKAESMEKDIEDQYEKMLLTLKQKQREAVEALEELKQESGEAWSGMKNKMDTMVHNLRIAVEQVEQTQAQP
jgi:uncharacterized lipoprotein NlpE involved in copper resistance